MQTVWFVVWCVCLSLVWHAIAWQKHRNIGAAAATATAASRCSKYIKLAQSFCFVQNSYVLWNRLGLLLVRGRIHSYFCCWKKQQIDKQKIRGIYTSAKSHRHWAAHAHTHTSKVKSWHTKARNFYCSEIKQERERESARTRARRNHCESQNTHHEVDLVMNECTRSRIWCDWGDPHAHQHTSIHVFILYNVQWSEL